jgi:hypothetical protein
MIVPATVALPYTGLALGYRVLTLGRTVYSAFTVAGVVETSVLGTYSVIGGVAAPFAGGYIVWGTAGTDYAEWTIDPGHGEPAATGEIILTLRPRTRTLHVAGGNHLTVRARTRSLTVPIVE